MLRVPTAVTAKGQIVQVTAPEGWTIRDVPQDELGLSVLQMALSGLQASEREPMQVRGDRTRPLAPKPLNERQKAKLFRINSELARLRSIYGKGGHPKIERLEQKARKIRGC